MVNAFLLHPAARSTTARTLRPMPAQPRPTDGCEKPKEPEDRRNPGESDMMTGRHEPAPTRRGPRPRGAAYSGCPPLFQRTGLRAFERSENVKAGAVLACAATHGDAFMRRTVRFLRRPGAHVRRCHDDGRRIRRVIGTDAQEAVRRELTDADPKKTKGTRKPQESSRLEITGAQTNPAPAKVVPGCGGVWRFHAGAVRVRTA